MIIDLIEKNIFFGVYFGASIDLKLFQVDTESQNVLVEDSIRINGLEFL